LSFDLILGKFIRGAAVSLEEQSIYLIEANHQLFAIEALPSNRSRLAQVVGADALEQATLLTITPHSVVSHTRINKEGSTSYCTRRYDLLTSAGTCSVSIHSDDIRAKDTLALGCAVHQGYPPDDAKKLEDTPVG
jgi:hypothetical protein